jgi:hypothetical protein
MSKEQRTAKAAALQSPETFAVVLYALLNEQYGDDWLYWDPTTIFMELRDDFGGEPSSESMDRIAAVQVLMTGGAFFEKLDAFLGLSNTLASGTPAFSVFDPGTVPEAAWALAEASFIREFLPFSAGIQAYIKTSLEVDGYKDDYPDIFDPVLGAERPDADAVREEAVAYLHNKSKEELDGYMNEQLEAMVYQFNELGMGHQLGAILKEKDRHHLI